MGYLDGDTVTVDAILTKSGRRRLSEGTFNVLMKYKLGNGTRYSITNPVVSIPNTEQQTLYGSQDFVHLVPTTSPNINELYEFTIYNLNLFDLGGGSNLPNLDVLSGGNANSVWPSSRPGPTQKGKVYGASEIKLFPNPNVTKDQVTYIVIEGETSGYQISKKVIVKAQS